MTHNHHSPYAHLRATLVDIARKNRVDLTVERLEDWDHAAALLSHQIERASDLRGRDADWEAVVEAISKFKREHLTQTSEGESAEENS